MIFSLFDILSSFPKRKNVQSPYDIENHNSMLNMTIYSIVQIWFQNLWFEFEMIEGPSFATWFQLS